MTYHASDIGSHGLPYPNSHLTRMQFDGFDDADPAAPGVFRCSCCDALRHAEIAYCADCDDVTPSYVFPIAGFVREQHTGLIHHDDGMVR